MEWQEDYSLRVARGLFSNEAGMGSTPHAHAVAKVDKPSHQGSVAIITVFIDTFVVLTCTAFVIIMTGGVGSGLTGITLTQLAFNRCYNYDWWSWKWTYWNYSNTTSF